YGINGGVGAGTEIGELPKSGGNPYATFTLELKNLYGLLEISDKAVRASESNAGAFVNLLNAEMEGMLRSAKHHFGRMLYGDGKGVLATVVDASAVASGKIYVDSVKNLMEGMIIGLISDLGQFHNGLQSLLITKLDRVNNIIYCTMSGSIPPDEDFKVFNQISYNNELTGLGAIFDSDSPTLYGLNRADYHFLNPYQKALDTYLTSAALQEAIDYVEYTTGGNINFIAASYPVRRSYVEYLSLNRMNLDYMNLDGGYKALSYSGIPFVADKFVADDTLYLLNTDDFKIHQLCDWRWLENDNGSVLRAAPTKAVYQATLVKYCDLLCERPAAQAKLSGIQQFVNAGAEVTDATGQAD
ncbi:MAG TPA: phage major capsid protein, partial [Eubacteriales bacterium]|nr:phage major capsid protein [Eubacteriales bacterium]